MAVLAENHYGKSRVRLVKVTRHEDHNDVFEWTVGVYLTGDFELCYAEGDNAGVLATDTMKNTVYAVARTSTAVTIEAFALELATFLQGRNPQASSVRITIEEKNWTRLKAEGPEGKRKHPSAFIQRGPDVATAEVTVTADAAPVLVAGVKGLVILKTADSAFHGFLRDELTLLPETSDRLMGTEATITWVYPAMPAEPEKTRFQVMDVLLDTFANHRSLSVQHTLYDMAAAALGQVPEIAEMTLTMPNRHNIPVNLAALGMDNPNTIFVPTDEPHGHIHARITR